MDLPNDLMREKERRKVLLSENPDWSNLCPDILRPILESLSPIEFHRAKTVCSNWCSVSKTCMKRSLRPWQITYQGDSSSLFDLKKDKSYYKTKVLGLSSKSCCLASYGNWILLVNSCFNFYILNLLTCKWIKLPIMDSSMLNGKWEDIVGFKQLAVLWINERTEDYVVAWVFKQHYLFSLKKGNDSWYNWNSDPWRGWNRNDREDGYFDMAYKNSKLYLYTLDHHIKILNISGYQERENQFRPFHFVEHPWEYIWKRRIAIRNSGEVLIILSLKDVTHEEKLLFYVFKMNLESGEWERVDSIGDDEMLIFGHGVTIRAPVRDAGDGIKSDSICFVDDDLWPDVDRPANCGVFDLATSKITWPKRFGVYIDQTQWFVPAST